MNKADARELFLNCNSPKEYKQALKNMYPDRELSWDIVGELSKLIHYRVTQESQQCEQVLRDLGIIFAVLGINTKPEVDERLPRLPKSSTEIAASRHAKRAGKQASSRHASIAGRKS